MNLPVSSAMTDKLSELRQTINQLDDEILALVRRRMVLAADVIAAKNGGAAYRPGREAEVMDRLVAAAPDLPARLVVNLWRQLMTASTALQNDSMTIAVHRDAMAVAGWHFGGFFTTVGCDDLALVRQAMEKGADIALVPAGYESEMAGWLLDEPGLHVIARTPPVASSTLVPVWMIGRQPADPVAEECTLVARHGTGGPELELVVGRYDSAAEDGARVIGVIASNSKTD